MIDPSPSIYPEGWWSRGGLEGGMVGQAREGELDQGHDMAMAGLGHSAVVSLDRGAW